MDDIQSEAQSRPNLEHTAGQAKPGKARRGSYGGAGGGQLRQGIEVRAVGSMESQQAC